MEIQRDRENQIEGRQKFSERERGRDRDNEKGDTGSARERGEG